MLEVLAAALGLDAEGGSVSTRHQTRRSELVTDGAWKDPVPEPFARSGHARTGAEVGSWVCGRRGGPTWG